VEQRYQEFGYDGLFDRVWGSPPEAGAFGDVRSTHRGSGGAQTGTERDHTWGNGARCPEAAQLLRAKVASGVLDLRWLAPLDEEAIRSAATRANGKVVVAHGQSDRRIWCGKLWRACTSYPKRAPLKN